MQRNERRGGKEKKNNEKSQFLLRQGFLVKLLFPLSGSMSKQNSTPGHSCSRGCWKSWHLHGQGSVWALGIKFWCFLGFEWREKSRGFANLLVQMDDLWTPSAQSSSIPQNPGNSSQLLSAASSLKHHSKTYGASVLYMVTKKMCVLINAIFLFPKENAWHKSSFRHSNFQPCPAE